MSDKVTVLAIAFLPGCAGHSNDERTFGAAVNPGRTVIWSGSTAITAMTGEERAAGRGYAGLIRWSADLARDQGVEP